MPYKPVETLKLEGRGSRQLLGFPGLQGVLLYIILAVTASCST